MHHQSLEAYLRNAPAAPSGPVAMIFAEDEAELTSTLRHHRDRGFAELLLFAARDLAVPEEARSLCTRVDLDLVRDGALTGAVNAMIAARPGTWLYYCYNAEYLFFPFCETRTVGEMLAFHAEERRDAMIAFVVDLYAGDLSAAPDAVAPQAAQLDRSGYYALSRQDADGKALDRQLDFFGGLRWRFEEHVPPAKRRIDRIALFRARAGLHLRDDHTFDDPEYNTYACPWHHSLTATICSFRTAKALRRNPGSREHIRTFQWHNSVPFEWQSRQLLDLGLIEPGQWF